MFFSNAFWHRFWIVSGRLVKGNLSKEAQKATLSASRLGRIYTSLPAWSLLCADASAAVLEDPAVPVARHGSQQSRGHPESDAYLANVSNKLSTVEAISIFRTTR